MKNVSSGRLSASARFGTPNPVNASVTGNEVLETAGMPQLTRRPKYHLTRLSVSETAGLSFKRFVAKLI